MKTVTLAAAILLSQAQYDPQTWFQQACPTCKVETYVDLPAQSSTIHALTVFQGWGFQCNSGQLPERVDVWVEGADSAWTPLPASSVTLVVGNARPDVAVAFSAACPNVPGNTGWTVWVRWPSGLTGAHRVLLNVWRGPFHTAQIRTYTIGG